jgi:4-amino-4-deoxy-L-arabinose transferase-like glycosyltransferase
MALVLIAGAAVLLRVLFFQGYVNSDPAAYAILANDLSRGIVHIRNYDDGVAAYHLRFGIYAPVAGFIRLFGLSEVTLAIYPFLASITSLLFVYVLSRRIFNPIAGLISMAMLAIVPIDIAMSSTLWPDPIAAAWANAGMALLVIAVNKNNKPSSVVPPVLAGLCFGIAWLCKESVVYLAPVVIWYLLFDRQQQFRSHIVWVGLGAIFVLAAESVVYQISAADLLHHFHGLKRIEEQSAVLFFDQKSPFYGWPEGGYAKALARRLLLSGPSHLLRDFSALPAFAMVAAAWGALVKDRRFLLPGIWFLTLMAMFNFSSMSLEDYRPLPVEPERYFYLVISPAVILIGGLVATLAQSQSEWILRRERRFWAGTIVFVLVVLSIYGARQLTEKPEQGAADAARRLSASELVYTDYRTAATLVFFRTGLLLPSVELRSRLKNTAAYENLTPDEMQSGAYVLLNKRMTEWLETAYGYEAPNFVKMPPKTWTEVWREGDTALFRIN